MKQLFYKSAPAFCYNEANKLKRREAGDGKRRACARRIGTIEGVVRQDVGLAGRRLFTAPGRDRYEDHDTKLRAGGGAAASGQASLHAGPRADDPVDRALEKRLFAGGGRADSKARNTGGFCGKDAGHGGRLRGVLRFLRKKGGGMAKKYERGRRLFKRVARGGGEPRVQGRPDGRGVRMDCRF